MPIRMVALSLAMLLTACTHYRYIDPQTPEGLACMHALDAKVNACEARFKAEQDGLNSLRESQAMSAQQCEHFNTSNMPNACPPVPSPSTVSNPCRNGYAEKYKACGGRIEKVEQSGLGSIIDPSRNTMMRKRLCPSALKPRKKSSGQQLAQ